MSEFPHLPLFIDAYLADTRHLTAQEHGAYLLLLMMAWRTPGCRLPDDDAKLAKWACVDARTWARIKSTIMDFWVLDDGFWKQKRLSKTREVVSTRAEVARENGKHGGRPKALENNESENPTGLPRVTQEKASKSKSRKEEPISNDIGAKAPEDLRFALFNDGLASLMRQTGKPESSARPLLGKWLKVCSDDAAKLLTVIRQAEADRRAEPIAWIGASIRPHRGVTVRELFARG